MDYSKTFIKGHLGKDVKFTTTPNGNLIAEFPVARGYKSKGKEWVEWYNIKCFGKLAENCQKYLSKGSAVFVECDMHTSKYKDKDGNDKIWTEFLANVVQFMSGNNKKNESNNEQNLQSQEQYQPEMISTDDIPF